MLRNITELKGLIIDAENFSEKEIKEFTEIISNYKCLFFVLTENKAKMIKSLYPNNDVKIYDLTNNLLPNNEIYFSLIKQIDLQPTEIAYVSKNLSVLKNIMRFSYNTIWITSNELSYVDISYSPDFICKKVTSINNLINKGTWGYFGETYIYPDNKLHGTIPLIPFDTENKKYPLYILGRYYGRKSYIGNYHPYSVAIRSNKSNSIVKNKYNDDFAYLYSTIIKIIQQKVNLDGIVSVPPKKGEENRFIPILNNISNECNIPNLTDNFYSIKNFTSQKVLPPSERIDNVKDVFYYKGSLENKTIILIDDVITTGATIKNCILALENSNVKQVIIIVLGLNQKQIPYWTELKPKIVCPICNKEMILLSNSNKEFFYKCYACNKTMDFQQGKNQIIEFINNKKIINKMI